MPPPDNPFAALLASLAGRHPAERVSVTVGELRVMAEFVAAAGAAHLLALRRLAEANERWRDIGKKLKGEGGHES